MTQEDYLAAIKKQQSLIRRLLSSRKRRSEEIQELTEQRYGHLIGRFFRTPEDENPFICLPDNTIVYICGIYASCYYAHSDEVCIDIACRHLYGTWNFGKDDKILKGFSFDTQNVRFRVDADIEHVLEPLYIKKEDADGEYTLLVQEFVHNFLETDKKEKKDSDDSNNSGDKDKECGLYKTK